jgi:hypothetical protein
VASWDGELRGFVQRSIALRRAHPALRRGELIWLWAESRVVVYARRLGSEVLITALNASHDPVSVDLPISRVLPDGTTLRDVWSGQVHRVGQGHVEDLHVPARAGRVLEAASAG